MYVGANSSLTTLCMPVRLLLQEQHSWHITEGVYESSVKIARRRYQFLKKRVRAARKNGSRAEVKGLNDELYALSGNTA